MAPLKRREELQALSQDHHSALVIAVRCRRLAEEAPDARRAEAWASVREFCRVQVLPHFQVEEQYLLPALRTLGQAESEMAERIASEHVRLRALMDETDPHDADLLTFGQLLDDHVRYEERVVFASTQDRLDTGALADLRRASLEVPQLCPTTFRPLPRKQA